MSLTGITEKFELEMQQLAGMPVLGREEITLLLAEYARYIGVSDFQLDEQGTAEIAVDQEVDLTLLHVPHLRGLIVAASLAGQVADDGALARSLLQANRSWAQLRGVVFAMLPGKSEPMLCRLIVPISMDVNHLDNELALFVDLVRQWRDEIDDFLEADDEPADPPVTTPPHFIRV